MQNLSDLEIREKCLGMTDEQLQDAATNVARVYNVCKDIVDRRLGMNGHDGHDEMNGMNGKSYDGMGGKSYDGYDSYKMTGRYSPRMSPRSRSLSPAKYSSPRRSLSPMSPRRSLSPTLSPMRSMSYMNGSNGYNGYNSADSGYTYGGENAMTRRTYGDSLSGVGSNGYNGYKGMSKSQAGKAPHKCRGRKCGHMSHKNKGMYGMDDMHDMDSYDGMNGYNGKKWHDGYNGSKSPRKYHRSMSPRRRYSGEMNGGSAALGTGIGIGTGALLGAPLGPAGIVGGAAIGGLGGYTIGSSL